jgi:malate dehydrogenase
MKIAIVGASGNIGSSTAFCIATRRLADEMLLIDNPRAELVAFQAWDMNTAVTGHDITIRAGDFSDIGNAGIVIVAAGSAKISNDRKEVLPQNLPIIQEVSGKVREYCPEAVIITVTNPVCPLNYAMYRCSGLDRSKIIGYSYNDSIRFRMRLGQELGVPSSRVQGTVIGEHGNSAVQLFSSVRLDGKPYIVTEELKQKMRRQLWEGQKQRDEFVLKTGRTAAWTTAMGLTDVVNAIARDTGETIPCSVPLEGEYGCHDLSMSVPVVLFKGGVKRVLEWQLAPDEQDLLNRSIEILKPAVKYVEELLHLCKNEESRSGYSYEPKI